MTKQSIPISAMILTLVLAALPVLPDATGQEIGIYVGGPFSVDLGSVQAGLLGCTITFEVHADTELVDFQVIATCLYMAGDPSSEFVIPVANGTEVEPEFGNATAPADNHLLWDTTTMPIGMSHRDGTVTIAGGIDYGNGMKAAESEIQEFESGQSGAFSQNVYVSIEWEQITLGMPAGFYCGFVKLKGRQQNGLWTEAEVRIYFSPSLGAVTPTVDLGSVQMGLFGGTITFEVQANVQGFDLQVIATCLYKGDDPSSEYAIPLEADGCDVIPNMGNATDGDNYLLWDTATMPTATLAGDGTVTITGGTLYKGMQSATSEQKEFESGQNGHFSQNVEVEVKWDQIAPELPGGEYSGFVKLKGKYPGSPENGPWAEAEAHVYVVVLGSMNESPVAEAGGPYVADEGLPITFDASASSDPDGGSLVYRWDFENDGTWNTGWSVIPTASVTWDDNWVGTAIVEVSDGELTHIDIADVTVNNVPPTAHIDPVDQPIADFILPQDMLILTGSFTDAGSDTYTIAWDFGDGTAELEAELVSLHAYAQPGEYTVTLTVTDDDGGMGTASIEIVVESPAEATEVVIENIKEMYLPQGTESSLTSKLENAIESLENGQDNAAVNKLEAFIQQVEAQRGKKLTDDEADELIADAQAIIDNTQDN